MTLIGTPSRSKDSDNVSRVVPGVSVTIARSNPSRRFSRLDLPTFGRPASTSVTPSFRMAPCVAVPINATRSPTNRWRRSSTRPSARKSTSSSGKSIAPSTIHAQVEHVLGQRAHAVRERAGKRTQRTPRGCCRPARDQIGYCLRLSEVHLAVQKCSLGELARAREPRTELERALRSRSMTTGPPCPCSSTTFSPVNECGAANASAMPASIDWSGASRNRATVEVRSGISRPHTFARISRARGPEIRTIPMPPRPGGVATAAMVSRSRLLPSRSGLGSVFAPPSSGA